MIKKINCLHLCNDLVGSKVHSNLYSHLERQNINQTIFYAKRKSTIATFEKYLKNSSFDIVTSKPMKNYHKLFFQKKVNFLYQALKSNIDLTNYDLTHATNLFSDGAIAFRIFQDYGIPYIIAVRGSDVNKFFKYRIDLQPLAKKILLNASRIIFISRSIQDNFFKYRCNKKIKIQLEPKLKIIFNGIDSYWLENRVMKKNLNSFNVLYIGNLSKNKNSVRLCKAILKLKNEFPKIKLQLVGDNGEEKNAIVKMSKMYPDNILYHGSVFQKEKLKNIYRDNDIFAMPSFGETFGLVYIEALTQGLPYVCTKNQGIDKSINLKIGESVKPDSIDSISNALKKIYLDYSKYETSKVDYSEFDWENIAEIYKYIYTIVSKSSSKIF